ATKFAAERLVIAADAPGFRTVAIRPRAIVGPHDTVLLPRVLRAARQGRFPLPGGGASLIEPTDVRDAAAAFVAADRHRAQAGGRAVNVSG
ncbi:NAD-dependent epimerase/dehydratase family protein, partial [Acinetobacter baumannii]